MTPSRLRGRDPRSRAGRTGRAGLVPLAVLVVALTAGCPATGSPLKEPNDVDEARAQELLDDPWVAATDGTLTSFQRGTNNLYSPSRAFADRGLQGTAEVTILAEVAAARRAGWSPFYAQCPDAVVRDFLRPTEGHLMVLLDREMADGALALASVLINGEDVYVRASAPNHAAPGMEPPAEIDPLDLSCLSPEGRGVPSVGEALDIARAS